MKSSKGRKRIPQFSLTNLAETFTTMDANLIFFLKQQKAMRIKTPNAIQRPPTIIDAVLFSASFKWSDEPGVMRKIPNKTKPKMVMKKSKYTKTLARNLMMTMNKRERTIAIGIETKIITQLFFSAAIFWSIPWAPIPWATVSLILSEVGKQTLPWKSVVG